MLTCKICRRKFKSKAALGGHISNAHPKQPTEPAVTRAKVTQKPAGQAALPHSDESIAEEIRNYLKRGYTFEQLTKQFGYKESTVRQEIEKTVPPQNNEFSKGGNGLPAVRKVGGGAEIITPEAVLRSYMDGDDSDALELRGMMKLRAAMLMVMDLLNIRKADAEAYALMVKPILEMMKEAREEQDAAAQRARASVTEAAREAAYEAAGETAKQVAAYFEQKKPDIATTEKPLEGLLARLLETTLTSLMGKLLPGAGGNVPAGFTVEKGA